MAVHALMKSRIENSGMGDIGQQFAGGVDAGQVGAIVQWRQMFHGPDFGHDFVVNKHRPGNVITSYSIHYTKLYDESDGLVGKVGTGHHQRGEILQQQIVQRRIREHDAEIARITSYNVCYTKLLRDFPALVMTSANLSDERIAYLLLYI